MIVTVISLQLYSFQWSQFSVHGTWFSDVPNVRNLSSFIVPRHTANRESGFIYSSSIIHHSSLPPISNFFQFFFQLHSCPMQSAADRADFHVQYFGDGFVIAAFEFRAAPALCDVRRLVASGRDGLAGSALAVRVVPLVRCCCPSVPFRVVRGCDRSSRSGRCFRRWPALMLNAMRYNQV